MGNNAKYKNLHSEVTADCPYCGGFNPPQTTPENKQIIQKCQFCGMKFLITTEYYREHTTYPDCEINGHDHKWFSRNVNDRGLQKKCESCDICGKWSYIGENHERKLII